jgi:phospholipid/cholesterol/gamma-HCH transport system permease protein
MNNEWTSFLVGIANKYGEGRARFNRFFDAFWIWLFAQAKDMVTQTGELATFGWSGTRQFFTRPFRFGELMVHMEFVGNKSIMIICLSGLFTGMALAFQIFLGFKKVNAGTLVGPTVALGIFRELGPVLTGLIVSARAGGAMAARLGTMRVTEQIDALEVMGVNPLQYLVSPRIIAAVIVMPLLTAVFDFAAEFGSWLICSRLLEMDEAQYWDRIISWIVPSDIFQGLFKAAVFGLFFAVICSYRGYTTKGGAAGVGSATNRGVVLSMLMIIILDFFVSNLITLFFEWKAVLLR